MSIEKMCFASRIKGNKAEFNDVNTKLYLTYRPITKISFKKIIV